MPDTQCCGIFTYLDPWRGAKWMGKGAIKQPGFKHHPLEGAGTLFMVYIANWVIIYIYISPTTD